MPPSVTPCPKCGAHPRSDARFCEFCGALLTTRAASDSPVETLERRFAELERHPSFGDLLSKRPSAAGPIAQNAVGALFLAGFVVFTAFMITKFEGSGGMIAMPIVILVIVVIGFFTMVGRGARLASAELVAQPALVAGERTKVVGGGDGSSSTHYFVTLESRDGKRIEFTASSKLAGRVSEGDMGVAYLKADHLIDFERVRV